MARNMDNEAKLVCNDVNRIKQGYGLAKLSVMEIESAERDTFEIEVANNGERAIGEINGQDLMDGKVAKIIAHDGEERE